MIGYRRTALRLHGMSERDRAWILRSLTAEQKGEIERLLVELREMGVPKDNSWLPVDRDIASRSEKGQEHNEPIRTLVDLLEEASPDQIKALFTDECDPVIAAVLNCHAWTWKQVVLNQLSPIRRDTLLSKRTDKLSPLLRNAIFEEVVQKYRNLQQKPHASATRTTGRRRKSLASWFSLTRKPTWQR